MSKMNLILLGNRIRKARKECGLTQRELAKQTGLAVKTIQDIERGRKNPTYETLTRLIERLGISFDTLFHTKATTLTRDIKDFLDNFQLCDPKGQEILLKTLHFLAEQLRTNRDEPD